MLARHQHPPARFGPDQVDVGRKDLQLVTIVGTDASSGGEARGERDRSLIEGQPSVCPVQYAISVGIEIDDQGWPLRESQPAARFTAVVVLPTPPFD